MARKVKSHHDSVQLISFGTIIHKYVEIFKNNKFNLNESSRSPAVNTRQNERALLRFQNSQILSAVSVSEQQSDSNRSICKQVYPINNLLLFNKNLNFPTSSNSLRSVGEQQLRIKISLALAEVNPLMMNKRAKVKVTITRKHTLLFRARQNQNLQV